MKGLYLFLAFSTYCNFASGQTLKPINVLGIQISGCNGDRDGELIFLYAGCGFAVDSLVINLDSTYGVYSDRNDFAINQKNERCKWKRGDLTVFEECDNLHAAGSGDYIPPGSFVIIQMTADMGTISSLKGECGLDVPIYVIANDCVRVDEAFPIHGIRKDSFRIEISLSTQRLWSLGAYYWTHAPDKSIFDRPLKLYLEYPGVPRAYAYCDTHTVLNFTEHLRALFPELKVQQPSCDGNGSLEFPFLASQYSIDGGTSWSRDSVFKDLEPGIYDPVAWDDQTNCPVRWPYQVTLDTYVAPDFLTIWWLNQLDTTCQGNFGGLIIDFQVGQSGSVDTSLFEFSIDSGQTFQASSRFYDLLAGGFDLAIRDRASPQCVVHHHWASPPLPESLHIIGLGQDSVGSCHVGRVIIQATGQDLLYSIDGINYSSDSLVLLEPNRTQIVYVKESAHPNCVDSLDVYLYQANEFIPEVDLVDQAATFFLLAESKGPYQLLWSTGDTTTHVENLPEGINSIKVTDAWGCTQQYDFFVPSNSCVFHVSDSIVDATCQTQTTSIYLISTDTVNTYQYNWSLDAFDGLPYIENVPHGTFEVEISYGLCSKKIEYTTPIGGITSVRLETQPAVCLGNEGVLQVREVTGGQGPYRLNISTDIFDSTIQVNGLAAGVHPYTIQDNKGCVYLDTFFIEKIEDPPIASPQIQVTDCDQSTYEIDLNGVTGGTPPYEVFLNNVAYPDLVISDLSYGDYELEVVDHAGCRSGLTILNLHKIPVIELQNNDTLILPGSPIYLSVTGDVDLLNNINWASNDFNCVCTDTLLMHPSEDLYFFSFAATTYGRECLVNRKFRIKYLDEHIYIPNSFTPNGDGTNDVFEIFAPNHELITVQIYNRWGGKVYSYRGMDAPWDGSNGSSSNEAGVYTYIAQLMDTNGKIIQKAGMVTLIK